MDKFIQQNPAVIIAFMGLLMSYFLWSSNQTLSRINSTLDKHAELIMGLIKEFNFLKGEHESEMRNKE